MFTVEVEGVFLLIKKDLEATVFFKSISLLGSEDPLTSVADPDPGSGIRDPGSGIGCLFDPWIRDPGSGIRDPGWEKVSIRIRDPG